MNIVNTISWFLLLGAAGACIAILWYRNKWQKPLATITATLAHVFPIWPVFSVILASIITIGLGIRLFNYDVYGVQSTHFTGLLDFHTWVFPWIWDTSRYQWAAGTAVVLATIGLLMSRSNTLVTKSLGIGMFWSSVMAGWILMASRYNELPVSSWALITLLPALIVGGIAAFCVYVSLFPTTHVVEIKTGVFQEGHEINGAKVTIRYRGNLSGGGMFGLISLFRREEKSFKLTFPTNAERVTGMCLQHLIGDMPAKDYPKLYGMTAKLTEEIRSRVDEAWGIVIIEAKVSEIDLQEDTKRALDAQELAERMARSFLAWAATAGYKVTDASGNVDKQELREAVAAYNGGLMSVAIQSFGASFADALVNASEVLANKS